MLFSLEQTDRSTLDHNVHRTQKVGASVLIKVSWYNEIFKNMEAGERVSYVGGIVSGLAYARWLRDKPDEKGLGRVIN